MLRKNPYSPPIARKHCRSRDAPASGVLRDVSAREGDVVVIAGKGHERGQYAGASVIPFDYREVAAEALGRRLASRGAP